MVELVEPGNRMTTAANPFADAVACAHTNYCLFDGRRLLRAADDTPASELTAFVHDGVRALTLNEHFTCVGAKSAIRQGAYRFALYPELGAAASSAGLAHDLFEFAGDAPSFDGEFTTFIASFAAPTAIFIVGLHAGSSRVARRFAWPTLVFNPHSQFDRLREDGRFERFQQVIRGAERALQGDVNPMMADFGERSEASQY